MLDGLKTKLREQPDLLTHQTIHGQAPIHSAAMKGYLTVIEFLAEQGSNINVRDHSGKTALHIAVQNGRLNIVERLLKIDGIEINAMEPFHSSPLHIASSKGFLAVAKVLVEAGADCKQASAVNHETNFSSSIDWSIGLPTTNEHARDGGNRNLYEAYLTAGNTPLHYSCLNGFKEMSAVLIEKGADLDATNRCGLTPLLYLLAHSSAVSDKQLELCHLLLSNGANPNVMGVVNKADIAFWRDGSLDSLYPIKVSEYFQKLSMTSFPAIRAGSSMFDDSKFNQPELLAGWTSPLHVGVILGDKIANLLIEYGADVNQQDARGWTPIQILMPRRIESFLLDELAKLASGQGEVDPIIHQINPNLKDDMGYRAHDWALFVDRHIDSVKGLLSLLPEDKRSQVAYETFWNHFGNTKSRPATNMFLGELVSEFPQLLTQPGPKDLLAVEHAVMDANRELLQWLHQQGVPLIMTPLLQEKEKELEAYFNANSNQVRDASEEFKWVTLEMIKSFEQP